MIVGSLGGDVRYVVNPTDNYFIHIYGNGIMSNYASTKSPFYSYRSSTVYCQIFDGVTHIGDYLFQSFTKLSEVRIPYTVTSISSTAFSGCTVLKTINFEGLEEPTDCSTSLFSSSTQTMAINVPKDYKGTTFCGKTVKKASGNWAVPNLS